MVVPKEVFAAMKGDPVNEPVDNKLRSDWNGFLDHLDKKGLRGKPSLDKQGLGLQLFDEYVKNNPATSLSRKRIPDVRNEILKYRNEAIQNAKSGKATIDNYSTFMKSAIDNENSANPDYTGSLLTNLKFPSATTTFIDNGVKTVKKIDFAPTNLALLK